MITRPLLPRTAIYFTLIIGMIGLVAAVHFPGLYGGFIFDDIPNFSPWQEIGTIQNSQDLFRFIFSSQHFPGRPLGLLSFLIDDQSFPADTFSLKRTGLAIHLVNALLILWLCLLIFKAMFDKASEQRIFLLSFCVALAWAISPIQVSNVAYIIQRPNMLTATFIFIALIAFIKIRPLFITHPQKATILLMLILALWIPTTVLLKENGLLAYLFILLIEYSLFSTPPFINRHHFWIKAACITPIVVFWAYIVIGSNNLTDGYQIRNFNYIERLITQGHVLVDYLYRIIIPSTNNPGLYNDNFPIARSMLNPIALLSWLGVCAITVIAFHWRKKIPTLWFGWMFFLIGHSMESTIIPLEIYFEHRNYLPQFGIWIAVIGCLNYITSVRWKWVAYSGFILLQLIAVMSCYANSILWGNPQLQAEVWHNNNPSSLRSTQFFALALVNQGKHSEAFDVANRAIPYNPNSFSLAIAAKMLSCFGEHKKTDFNILLPLTRSANYEVSAVQSIDKLQEAISQISTKESKCSPPDTRLIIGFYQGLLANPRYASSKEPIFQRLGKIYIRNKQYSEGVAFYDKAFLLSGHPIYAYWIADLYYRAGDKKSASTWLEKAKRSVNFKHKLKNPDLIRAMGKLSEEIKR